MKSLANLIWLICGGFWAALGYLFGGLVLCITIVGIPFGMQCFKLSKLMLWPFGKQIVNAPHASGCLSIFANILWIIFGGFATALNHLIWAFLLAITIIGLPFAKQHLKLLEVSLMPFGKRIVNQ